MTMTGCPQCAVDLARVPLFENLSPNDVLRLAASARRQHYPKDAVIFRQGQQADGIYILLDGAVKLLRSSPDGRQQILHTVAPPNAFAEAAAFAGGKFPAHAVALAPCDCLFLPREALLEQIGKYPEMTMRLLASMSLRLQQFARLIEDLSLREVSGRLARYLIEESERVGRRKYRLPLSKGELAQQLGTSAETLSRTFTRFREQGLLDTSGQQVHLLNVDALGEILEM
jgi:CRP/FNR family transcriptional regulator